MLQPTDIHYALLRPEQPRPRRTFEADLGRPARPARGMRLRVGQALIGAGRVISGAAADTPTARAHTRPVSAHR